MEAGPPREVVFGSSSPEGAVYALDAVDPDERDRIDQAAGWMLRRLVRLRQGPSGSSGSRPAVGERGGRQAGSNGRS